MLHIKYESSGPCGFGEEDFFLCFSHDAPEAGPMDPRGKFGRIYKENHYTLLHTKYESSGLVVLEMFFPIVSLWELMTPGPGSFLKRFIARNN